MNYDKKELKKALAGMDWKLRYKDIVSMRFGLETGISQTLEETGKHFGLTRERIRQLEAKFLEMYRDLTNI